MYQNNTTAYITLITGQQAMYDTFLINCNRHLKSDRFIQKDRSSIEQLHLNLSFASAEKVNNILQDITSQ